MNIAVIGASGHIARSLIPLLARDKRNTVYAFSRNPHSMLPAYSSDTAIRCKEYSSFPNGDFDVVLNCVGFSDSQKIRKAGADLFFVNEHYDNLAIDYVRKNSRTTYVYFSSGAVYGGDFVSPASSHTLFTMAPNNIQQSTLYGLTKLYTEAKHRSLPFPIIDLRIFSYFSRFIDPTGMYLMTAIIRCLRNHNIFKTGADDITRDYVHPEDLKQLLYCCLGEPRNSALDVYSKMPAKKSEIIAFFKEVYGLNVELHKTNVQESITGIKPCYYSQNHAAEHIGYVPQFSSMDCIQKESAALLNETT